MHPPIKVAYQSKSGIDYRRNESGKGPNFILQKIVFIGSRVTMVVACVMVLVTFTTQ